MLQHWLQLHQPLLIHPFLPALAVAFDDVAEEAALEIPLAAEYWRLHAQLAFNPGTFPP